jgi:hypothetical protein
LPDFVLDDVSAGRLPRAVVDSGSGRCQLASDLNPQFGTSLVLKNLQRTVANIRTLELEHISRSLAGEQCRVHRIHHRAKRMRLHLIEFGIREVPGAPRSLKSLTPWQEFWRAAITPLSDLVEDMRKK